MPFGPYMLLKRLAVGGMAELFLATDTRTGGFVVLKRILPYLAEDSEFLAMFLDEARIASMLHHPAIVEVKDLGHLEGSTYIAMEWVDGIDLRRMLNRELERGGGMPFGVAAWIVARLCEGLHVAHTCLGEDGRPLGIIHRDISPQNVMVTYKGDVKLVDFGIAKATAWVTRSKPGVIKGKFLYLAPEQLGEDPVDARVDLFAMGSLLYELTCGQSPFYRSSTEAVIYAVKMESPPLPQSVRVGYPPALARIVMRCLEKDRERRFQSAEEIRQALEDFMRVDAPTTRGDVAKYLGGLFGGDHERTRVFVPPNARPSSGALNEDFEGDELTAPMPDSGVEPRLTPATVPQGRRAGEANRSPPPALADAPVEPTESVSARPPAPSAPEPTVSQVRDAARTMDLEAMPADEIVTHSEADAASLEPRPSPEPTVVPPGAQRPRPKPGPPLPTSELFVAAPSRAAATPAPSLASAPPVPTGAEAVLDSGEPEDAPSLGESDLWSVEEPRLPDSGEWEAPPGAISQPLGAGDLPSTAEARGRNDGRGPGRVAEPRPRTGREPALRLGDPREEEETRSAVQRHPDDPPEPSDPGRAEAGSKPPPRGPGRGPAVPSEAPAPAEPRARPARGPQVATPIRRPGADAGPIPSLDPDDFQPTVALPQRPAAAPPPKPGRRPLDAKAIAALAIASAALVLALGLLGWGLLRSRSRAGEVPGPIGNSAVTAVWVKATLSGPKGASASFAGRELPLGQPVELPAGSLELLVRCPDRRGKTVEQKFAVQLSAQAEGAVLPIELPCRVR